MREIILDPKLELQPTHTSIGTTSAGDIARPILTTLGKGSIKKLKTILHDKFIKEKGYTFLANSYFHYLAHAWSHHCSVVIRPDDIWYTFLSEFCAIVKANPEKFRLLFSKESEKQRIIVRTSDPYQIDTDLVIKQLKNRVPSDISHFIPEFSTELPNAKLAFNVVFCDLVSPYYSYGTLMCGIPKVRVDGSYEDWKWIVDSLVYLQTIVDGADREYVTRVYDLVQQLLAANADNNVKFFKEMVSLQRCGSGHNQSMSGWITKLINETDDYTGRRGQVQLEGLPSHIASMEYDNIDTGRKFNLFVGPFACRLDLESGYLIPNYESFIIEKTSAILDDSTEQPTTKNDDIKIIIVSQPMSHKNDGKFVMANYQVKYKNPMIISDYLASITITEGMLEK